MDNKYKEDHRPQFHFSPEANWMNDPNGMVFFQGEYHLFYQYYPDSTVWGPMHWGHAISKDLVHWQHLPIALYPDDHGLIFSGSAVVDWNNTSGFGLNNQPPLVAMFSYHKMEGEKRGDIDFQTQGIAYSNDKGRTWKKYDQNPVILNPGIKDFRDPKVIWHEASKHWIMVLAAGDHVKIYNSPNLKDWKHVSDFGHNVGSHDGVWECPDLFPLQGPDKEYWVLLQSMNPGNPNGGSGIQYFIGDFDGKNFMLDDRFKLLLEKQHSVWLDAGPDNYAGVTWSDIPIEDGRRIFLGWMSNWDYAQVVPTDKWRSVMTIPSELTIEMIHGTPRIVVYPVEELDELIGNNLSQINKNEIYPLPNGLAQMNIFFEKPSSGKSGFKLFNNLGEYIEFYFNAEDNHFYFDRTKSGKDDFSNNFAKVHTVERLKRNREIILQVFIDHSSIEIFIDDGVQLFSEIYFPRENYNQIQFFETGQKKASVKGSLESMEGIW
ncbi:MAG: glycoside hydrolase family 32 protein [Bacteroidota bacterium]